MEERELKGRDRVVHEAMNRVGKGGTMEGEGGEGWGMAGMKMKKTVVAPEWEVYERKIVLDGISEEEEWLKDCLEDLGKVEGKDEEFERVLEGGEFDWVELSSETTSPTNPFSEKTTISVAYTLVYFNKKNRVMRCIISITHL